MPQFSERLRGPDEIDPDLRLIVERWEGLSVELRRAIVRMVR